MLQLKAFLKLFTVIYAVENNFVFLPFSIVISLVLE